MITLYYPECADKTAAIDAFRSSATIEQKSCMTGYGQARCIDGYDADGNHIVRNIICDASYFNAPNFDRGI